MQIIQMVIQMVRLLGWACFVLTISHFSLKLSQISGLCQIMFPVLTIFLLVLQGQTNLLAIDDSFLKLFMGKQKHKQISWFSFSYCTMTLSEQIPKCIGACRQTKSWHSPIWLLENFHLVLDFLQPCHICFEYFKRKLNNTCI